MATGAKVIDIHWQRGREIDINALEMLGELSGLKVLPNAKFSTCADCGAAVSASTTFRARRANRQPWCKSCAPRLKKKPASKDPAVYLCAVCRCVLTGMKGWRARYRAKSGYSCTCGSESCKREHRSKSSGFRTWETRRAKARATEKSCLGT
jgi:hypothetical protein